MRAVINVQFHGSHRGRRMIRTATTALFVLATAAALSADRPLNPIDLIGLEHFGAVSLRPESSDVAFVKIGSMQSPGRNDFGQAVLAGIDRSDIWLWRAESKTMRNLTNRAGSGRGCAAPQWSPDGRWLAFLSSRDDGNLCIGLWDSVNDKLTLFDRFAVSTGYSVPQSIAWLDGKSFLVVLHHSREAPPDFGYESHIASFTSQAWQKTRDGKIVSVGILDSGTARQSDEQLLEDLVIVSTSGDINIIDQARHFPEFQVARASKAIAYLVERDFHPPTSKVAMLEDAEIGPHALHRYELVVVRDLVNEKPVRYPGFEALLGSLRWSSDGGSFAVIGSRDGESAKRAFVGRSGSEKMTRLAILDPRPDSVVWSYNNRLYVSGYDDGEQGARIPAWYLVNADLSLKNISQKGDDAPITLCPFGKDKVVGLSGGQLLCYDESTGAWTNLSAGKLRPMQRIAWTNESEGSGNFEGEETTIVLKSSDREGSQYYALNSIAKQTLALTKVSGTLIAYAPTRRTAVFLSEAQAASELAAATDADVTRIAECGSELKSVRFPSRFEQINYRGVDGNQLSAWLLYPIDYEAGKKYPLVTRVYAGSTIEEEPTSGTMRRLASPPINPHLFAAAGYAVLIPSMPLGPMPRFGGGNPTDPYFDLAKGVIPAVDKAIELGVADPGRLALIGHSLGGYSVYSLVTQSSRFSAAVAVDGITDLISFYSMPPHLRYTERPHEFIEWQAQAEGRLFRTGGPPWKDWSRYLRNSPIFYVDRVRTPLLMIHGDLDGTSLTQAEEFFSALYRQGRRARLVTYYGELHFPMSPANIEDMWSRVLNWLDEYCDLTRGPDGTITFEGSTAKSKEGTATDFQPESWIILWRSQTNPRSVSGGSRSVDARRNELHPQVSQN